MKTTRLLATVMLVLGLIPSAPAISIPTANKTSTVEDVREVIASKIDFYNKQFPSIHFMHLEGGAGWREDMAELLVILGSAADNIDYVHPSNLQDELLYVVLVRIKQFLQEDVISSSAFRVDNKGKPNRPNVCVITLNPLTVLRDDKEATRYMLEMSVDAMAKVHPSRYLDHRDLLGFAIDHEAYHCLDSYHYGGIPQTKDPILAEYKNFKRESAADAYAMAMHVKQHGSITPYARNLVLVRALGVLYDTPSHYTFDTVREVLRIDPAYMSSRSTQGILELSRQIRDQTVGSYDGYIQHRAAVLNVTRRLAHDSNVDDAHPKEIQLTTPEESLAKVLMNRYQHYYGELFSDQPMQIEEFSK